MPRRTPLYERHRAAGAKLVDFAGWEMPIEYPTGLRAEHNAVRQACGIFDVSHMGQIESVGPSALGLLQRLTSNDVSAIAVGGAQYGLLCEADGGVLDDLFTYRLAEERYLTVTNASRYEHDLGRFEAQAGDGVELLDRRDELAMLAVQGPGARAIVGRLASGELPQRMQVTEQQVAGCKMLVCGTGYTGEDGVELICAAADAPGVWDELVGGGAMPAGLGARDTLRLEACFHLYGHDLSPERNPIEAGLGWCCREQTGFIGSEAVARARARGVSEKLVAFAIEGGGIAREGNPVVDGGIVSSGTLSPTLGIGVGLAYVPSERSGIGERLQIDVRGRVREALVKAKPLVAKKPSLSAVSGAALDVVDVPISSAIARVCA
ncbi:MAG TPA: glycine cleavage system aminomethyltransferase GcvT [Solirubrobacteraceae bacterium]